MNAKGSLLPLLKLTGSLALRKTKPFRRVLGKRAENYALQPKPFKESMRTRSQGGVAMGIKSVYGALKRVPGALFGYSKAFHCRASGVTLGCCCLVQHWDQLTGSGLHIPGLIL